MYVKRPDSVVKRRTLLSHVRHHLISSSFILPVEIKVQGEKAISVSVFINSRADTEFIDQKFAEFAGLELVQTNEPHFWLWMDIHYMTPTLRLYPFY